MLSSLFCLESQHPFKQTKSGNSDETAGQGWRWIRGLFVSKKRYCTLDKMCLLTIISNTILWWQAYDSESLSYTPKGMNTKQPFMDFIKQFNSV
jgi:hypothetical protein